MEPFSFPVPSTSACSAVPSTLGELRHTRQKLKLDLKLRNKGEASFLDDLHNDNAKVAPKYLDSGVGMSTNVSPAVSAVQNLFSDLKMPDNGND